MRADGQGLSNRDVTVVIPTYNGERFVADALRSVLAQTHLPREIIVVDDASPDGTEQVVRGVGRSAAVPIRFVRLRQNSGGPATPLNVGIADAQSDLVALLEQDDLMTPNRLERQIAAAARHPEAALVFGRPCLVLDDNTSVEWHPDTPPPGYLAQFGGPGSPESFLISPEAGFRAMLMSNFIFSNSTVLLRKSLCHDVGEYNPRWRINSDADFELRLLMKFPVAMVNATVCGYRSRADSLFHAQPLDSRLDGLLIRLKWSGRRWQWASHEAQDVYWRLRSELAVLLRSRRPRRALPIVAALLASSTTWRHLLSKAGRTDRLVTRP
jgi:glycosyltransferase involved in cell wall biosynthesis